MVDRRTRAGQRLGNAVTGAVGAFTVACATAFGTVPAAAEPTPTATSPSDPSPSLSPTSGTPDPTPTSSPTPTPTPDPSPTPTADPTPTAPPSPTPTPEPTDPPTADPTAPPTAEPTDPPTDEPAPTAPPSDEPQPLPTETQDPDEAYQDALEGAQTTAVAEAQRLIQIVLAAISGAETSLAQASEEAAAAREALEAATTQLKITEEAAARTQRDIVALQEQQDATRRTLGAVAAHAYQGGGTTTTMGALFSSDTPAELTDRYVGLDLLLRANDHALGTMAESQADLRNARATLEAQLQRSRQQSDQAEDLAESTAHAEAAAKAAQEALEDQNAKLEYALQLASEARLEDYRRYMELIGESTALGELLRDKTDYGPGFGTGDFVRPGTGDFTSKYGPRRHPILGYVKVHTGLDFGRGDGTIYAADAGTVIKAEWNRAYGYMVVLDHGIIDGRRISTMYAHQPGLSVSVGQRVAKGQPIGTVGSTGYSTGPHLHFEVYVDGQHTDPMPWVRGAPYPG